MFLDKVNLKEAPIKSPTQSPLPWGLFMGASSGASHHLAVMRKVPAKAKPKSTSKAFDSRRDAHFAALPRPQGRDKALAARAALPPGFSLAPRRAPRLGTPFGGLRGPCPLVPHGVRDWPWTGHLKHPRFLSEASPFARALGRGSEEGAQARRSCARGAGLCPPLENRTLGGATLPWGKVFRRLPPIPASGESGSCRLYAFHPASRFPTARGSLAAQRRCGAFIFTFLF